ncbi:MAG: hypothetical protein QME75_12460 [Deltaproteobacteria bacterium]|nr:hypothetical protein [Deltaproteobacteria bacterium]
MISGATETEKDHRPADTPTVEVEQVEPLDASKEGSVHHTLARLREERRWEPPEDPEGREEPPAAPPEDEEETDKQPPEAEPPPEEKPAGEFKYKYKDQREAELAYQEAERKMHAATTEKAEALRELEALKERLAALEKAQQETPPDNKEAVERIVDINSRIDDLDPYDPDYHRQKAELEIEKAVLLDSVRQRQALPSPDAIKEIVREEVAARQRQEQEAQELEDLKRQAVDLAKAHGLDMTPGAWDYRQFWRAVRAGEVPTGEGVTLEMQVKALAEEILADKASFGQAAVRDMQKIHEQNAVLGRGGAGPPGGGGGYRPSSIHEILAANRRRI